MTYTNWSLVAETPLPNGSRGAIAKRDIAAGTLLGIFQGELERIEIREDRLAEPDKHINLVQIARDGEGATSLIDGGDIPWNCSGGVLSSNPIGASGMIRFAEAARQVVEALGQAVAAGSELRRLNEAYPGIFPPNEPLRQEVDFIVERQSTLTALLPTIDRQLTPLAGASALRLLNREVSQGLYAALVGANPTVLISLAMVPTGSRAIFSGVSARSNSAGVT